MYYRISFQVSLANEFLRQTTDAKLAERNVSPELAADIQIFRAEARFLRALSYWHGIDLFGNIPLVTEADPIGSTPPAAEHPPGDLRLPGERADRHPGRPARVGRQRDLWPRHQGAAAMLLAKLYLNAEVYTGTPQYAQALAAAQPVIAGPFTLDPSYRHLFQADNNTSPEIIFPIIQDGLRTQTWGGMTFLVHASCGGTMNAAELRRRRLLVRPAPQAGGIQPVRSRATRGRSFFWTDRQTVQISSISNFSDGIPAPKFIERDQRGGAGLQRGPSGHRLPDVPARRRVSDRTPRPSCGAAAATGRRRWPT